MMEKVTNYVKARADMIARAEHVNSGARDEKLSRLMEAEAIAYEAVSEILFVQTVPDPIPEGESAPKDISRKRVQIMDVKEGDSE